MTTINDIPFSYLVSWAKKNRSTHPELSYLSTLSGKPGAASYGKWGSALSQIPVNKSLQKLQTALSGCQQVIISDYEDDSQVLVLPQNASAYGSFYERTEAFIKEYADELTNRVSGRFTNQETETRRKRAKVFKEMFEYSKTHCTPTDRGVIASSLKIARQMVDNLLKDVIKESSSILSGNQVDRVKADPMLLSEFAALKQKAGKMISRKSFIEYVGLKPEDGKTLEFLASMLGMTVMKQDAMVPVIASSRLMTDYTRQFGRVVDFFRNEVFGIRVDYELKNNLKGIKDQDLRESIRSLILNSDEFVKYQDGNDEAVALRWDLLLYKSSRLCWILFEKKAFDYATAIHESELIKSYNDHAKGLGVTDRMTKKKLPSANNSPECWKLMTMGRTGYWKIRLSQSEEYDLDAIIRDYIKANGADSYDGFISYMKSSGQYRFFTSESSLRTRFTGNGGVVKRKVKSNTKTVRLKPQQRQDMKDFIVDFLTKKNVTLARKDVSKALSLQFPGTSVGTADMLTEEMIKENKINSAIKGKVKYISALSVPITFPRTPADDVVDKAVDIIWASPNHEILSRDLTPLLKPLLPSTVNSQDTYISKALHGDPRIVFTGPQGHATVGLSKAAQAQMAQRKPLAPSSPAATVNTAAAAPTQLTLDINELKESLKKEFSLELQGYGIDGAKAVDKLITVIGMGKAITDTFTFYDLLTYVPEHYKGVLSSDRERTLKKESLSLVERFLKNYCELKYSLDIVTEIQAQWNRTNVSLRTIINYMEQTYGILPYKSTYYTLDERKVAAMVREVVDARNWQVGHPQQYMDGSKYNHEKLIHDSFFVMLYVSSKY